MKKVSVFLIVCVTVILGAVIYSGKDKKTIEPTLYKKAAIEFWVLSDPHYLDKSLTDSGSAFEKIKQTAAGKDLEYQEESWQAFIATAIKKKPDMIIITGDLTLNGEKISAERLADFLKQLTDKGINVFVIPGNHDVNDGWARKFVEDKQEKTEAITIADFKEIFADFGYQNATNYDKHSLSYSVAVNSTYDFLFLDSNIYPEDTEPQTRPATGGTIRGKTMTWVKEQLDASKKAQKKTLVFMHHNIYAHNQLLSNGFIINNADEFKQVLTDYQVPVVFSGHIHAQDIMTETINDEKLTEIVSSSFSITPQGYGVVKLDGQSLDYQKATNDVDAWAKETGNTTPEVQQYKTYLETLFMEDGKKLGYGQLINAGLTDEQELDIAAEFIGRMNVRFFSGNDFSTDSEVAKIKAEQGYQIIEEHSSFLKEYIDSIIQDKNEEDNRYTTDE
ncbi:metallophosphoesterase [Enterococcus termitis]|uniref:Calcineurin-like phosphoesterase domain-containing protein n=1 Tax=Enterococcus termitis TaxID=332950 RepID=A0A1E5H493_9ENTE|nr:metallophosphoesterase [Enterococcus termitis]OEG19721.1 hypothetical protein BCR25_14840 [Enterococcus termitis]